MSRTVRKHSMIKHKPPSWVNLLKRKSRRARIRNKMNQKRYDDIFDFKIGNKKWLW